MMLNHNVQRQSSEPSVHYKGPVSHDSAKISRDNHELAADCAGIFLLMVWQMVLEGLQEVKLRPLPSSLLV